MRKLILALLMASAAAAPAFAAPDDADELRKTRAERQQEREERREARDERVERVGEAREEAKARAEARAVARANGDDVESIRQSARERIEERQELREQRRETRLENRQLRQSERALPRVFQNPVPVVSNSPREGTQPPLRVEGRRSSPHKWSSNWRKDRRYDWWNWRNRHRSLFRLGFYYDPFGWSYRPYSIGWRLWPSYYSSRYWIHDPWMYRLPYAPPGYRWIRYWDDAVLVDTWSGEVVDVIYNFFW